MKDRLKKIIAIPGSTRKFSTHVNLISALADLAAETFEITIYKGIDQLPHFNPDLDNDSSPENVVEFRGLLKKADGILICTPEYAMGVPGTLKNALDWTVSSAEFYRKPVALITASSQGYKGHASLMETLNIMGSNIAAETQLIIPFIKTKINEKGTIIDPLVVTEIKKLIDSFSRIVT